MNTFKKKQFQVFVLVSLAVTLPFLVLTLSGQIKNESGLLMALPIIAGSPWVFLYILLPFDIPGFTSSAVPPLPGDIYLTLDQLFLFMLPVYINIYLLTYLIFRFKARKQE